MAYQSLYRRYRPRSFGEVVAQQHVVTALRNAVREGRTGHAYLFSGPRGTGKTSIARILAKALNCTEGADGEPCGHCESCVAMDNGASYDLHELDAASNNGVDAMRDLIAKAALGSPGRTKVYILDEVHMLSTAASNALLKTLEEPPPHVTFVLATTDPQRVLPTIRSRAQHFEFGLIPAADLERHVRHVMADAGIELDDEAVSYVLRKGAGSARDTLSALDQVAALGTVLADGEPLDGLLEALVARSTGGALTAVASALQSGREPRLLGEQLLARLRDAFLLAVGAPADHLPEDERARAADTGRRMGPAAVTRAMEAVGEALVEMRQAPDPRVPLEVALVRVTRPDLDTSLAALVERVATLERQLAAGAGEQGAAPASGAPAGGGPEGAGPDRPAPPTSRTADQPASDEPDLAPLDDGPAPRGRAGSGPQAPLGPAAEARRRLQDRMGGSPAAAPTPVPGPDPPAETSPGSGDRPARERPRSGRPPATAATAPNPAAATAPGPPASSAATAPGPPASSAATAPGPPASSAASGPATIQPPTPSPADAPTSGALARGEAATGDNVDLPGVDELSRAWSEQVFDRLGMPARARFRAGRFLAVENGAAVFGLPNGIHRDRCEEKRGEVEAALGVHFGRPVPLRLVVDGAASDPALPGGIPGGNGGSPGAGPGAAPGDGDDDEDLELADVHALPDANDTSSTVVDRLLQAFPGSQVLE